jgi:hypothetical protein
MLLGLHARNNGKGIKDAWVFLKKTLAWRALLLSELFIDFCKSVF